MSQKITINPNERITFDKIPIDVEMQLWNLNKTQQEDIIRLFNFFLTFIRPNSNNNDVPQKNIQELGEQLINIFSACSFKSCQFNGPTNDNKCKKIGLIRKVSMSMPEILQTECCIHEFGNEKEELWCDNCQTKKGGGRKPKISITPFVD